MNKYKGDGDGVNLKGRLRVIPVGSWKTDLDSIKDLDIAFSLMGLVE